MSADEFRQLALSFPETTESAPLGVPAFFVRTKNFAGLCHPEGERGPARARREAQAKAVCFECPAMAACRAHALQVHEPYGIWGGLSEGERAQMLALSAAH